MKSKFIASIAALCLFNLSSALASPSVDAYESKLKPALKTLLMQETQRRNIALDLDFKSLEKTGCDRCGRYQLILPAHIQRDTFMDVQLSFKNKRPKLSGQILTQAESDLLLKVARDNFGEVDAELDVFPFEDVGHDYALTLESGTNLYVKPIVKAGGNLATQVRLGTPLKILDYSPNKKMALVRVEDDGYIAWVERKAIREGDRDWYQKWLNERQVLLMSNLTRPQTLYFGTRLRLLDARGKDVIAELPNGKQISLPRSQVHISAPAQLPPAKTLLQTARQYLPTGPQGKGHYLWGGTFGKRLDCSGFVQTVYRAHGVYLPRDADQQMGFTRSVGENLKHIHELQPGDLVFFSSHGKYPTHVGLYIGKNQFIHSSAKGPYNGVKISTLKGGSAYDAYLQKIYYGGGRVFRSL